MLSREALIVENNKYKNSDRLMVNFGSVVFSSKIFQVFCILL